MDHNNLKKTRILTFLFSLFPFFLISGTGQAQIFDLPLDCEFGTNCYIQKYVDLKTGPDYGDYACGPLTNDHHRGTDFRLMDYDQLNKGVDILAAAPGKVIETRDYMPDVNVGLVGSDAVIDRGLGNMVSIQHADGYLTVYAHMKRHSIKVKSGEIVKAGQILGQVGMSGLTDYPHMHFEVHKDRQLIDPFTGKAMESNCGKTAKSLWKRDLPYTETRLIRLGLFSEKLNRHALEYKLYEYPRLKANAQAIMLNAYIAGIYKGDKFNVKIWHGQNETPFFDKGSVYTKDMAFAILHAGKSNLKRPWPLGEYRAQLTFSRLKNGQETIIIQAETSAIIE